MDIFVIFLLVFAVVLLVLILANVAVSQRTLNILFLILMILVLCNNSGWFGLRLKA